MSKMLNRKRGARKRYRKSTLPRRMRSEIKYIGRNVADTTDWDGAVQSFYGTSGIGQGVGRDDRIGNRIRIVGYRLNMSFNLDNVNVSLLRLVVCRKAGGNLASVDDVFQSTGSTAAGYTQLNEDNRYTIQFYHDKFISADVNTKRNQQIVLEKKLNYIAQFEDGAAVTPANHRLTIAYCSDDDNTAIDKPLLSWSSRVYFVEL